MLFGGTHLSMKTLILGGTGFIGKALSRALLLRGDSVITPSRSPNRVPALHERHTIPLWDGQTVSTLVPLVEQAEAVVNLTGENISEARWNASVRQRILDSRVLTGRALIQAFQKARTRPVVLIQASAVGCYGGWTDSSAAPCCTEATAFGTTFLASVCKAWEASTAEAPSLGIRRCVIRTSPVLGNGGMLKRLLPLYRLGLGGPLGGGLQPFPWIQLDDEVKAIIHLLDTENQGAYNLIAPVQNDMKTFARTLGALLHRPAFLPVPSILVRMRFGQMGEEVMLSGQKASARRLQETGYVFKYPDLTSALSRSLESA